MAVDVMLEFDAVPLSASNSISSKGIGSTTQPRLDAHLLVTAHFVRTGRVGGAEHMLYNLLKGLARHTKQLSVLCGCRNDLDRSFVETLEQSPSAAIVELGGHGSRFVAEQRACLDERVSGDSILFSNYFVPPLLPKKVGRATVVLHDMQYRHFPQYFSVRKRVWLSAAHHLALHRGDRMIVLSEAGRRDAIRWLGRSAARKLTVIPNPISWERFGPAIDTRPVERPYILSVAAQYPHKNLEVLVRAFAQLCRRDRDVVLVLCGQPYNALTGVKGQRAGLGQLIAELEIGERVLSTGYLDDLALGRWYRHASGFAFPSLFEGFGMPAVEALGFGLPTLLTRCAALPETSLGLGTFVDDPMNVGEWVSRLAAMMRDTEAYRIAASDVEMLRDHYNPDRVAKLYLDTCMR